MKNLLNQYLNEIKNTKTANTYDTYSRALELWFENDICFSSEYIVNKLGEWDCSQNTKVLRCRVLKKFIEYCSYYIDIPEKHIIMNIIKGFKIKDSNTEYVTQEQYQTLLHATRRDIRLQACIRLMYENGLRASEVLNIKTKDYNKNSKEIIIRDTKNGNDYVINITDTLNDLLIQIIDIKCDYLFHTINGTKIAYSNFELSVKRICNRCGYNNLHCHSFRHGSAMFLLENNVNLFTIKNHLRHKSIQSTQKYLHYTDKQRQEINNLFNKIS